MSIPSELLTPILKKAAMDADFRAKCLSDPAGAAREAGVELPAGLTFTEGVATASAIALPPVGTDSDEITDDQVLDSAAGGFPLDGRDPYSTEYKAYIGCHGT